MFSGLIRFDLQVRRALNRFADLGILSLLAPIFWYPWRLLALTLLALPVIPLLWVVRWHRCGVVRAGLAFPLTLLLAATSLATTPVVDWGLAMPRVLGMALGVATMVAVVNCLNSLRALRWALVALTGLTLVIAGTGLVSMKRPADKFSVSDPLYAIVTWSAPAALLDRLRERTNPNVLAGALVPLLPVVFAAAAGALSRPRTRVYGLSTALGGAVALAVLADSRSRSGWAGAAIALALLSGALVVRVLRAARSPVALRAIVVIAYVLLLLGGAWRGERIVVAWVSTPANAGEPETFASRVELWDRAVRMIRDFPLTGVGLGQFNRVLHERYPPMRLQEDEDVRHAHDLALEYAAEMGLPGITALGLLLFSCFRECVKAARSADPLLRNAGLGTALGIVGMLVYGLTDATEPGARPGLVMWVILGVGYAAGGLADRTSARAAVTSG